MTSKSQQSRSSILHALDIEIMDRIRTIESELRDRYSIELTYKIDAERSLVFGNDHSRSGAAAPTWSDGRGLYVRCSWGSYSLSAMHPSERVEALAWSANLFAMADYLIEDSINQRKIALEKFDYQRSMGSSVPVGQ